MRSHLRQGLSVVCLSCTVCSVICVVVRRCAISRRYINVCNGGVFSVVNVYLDHLKFCVVCIGGRRYVCCSECNVVSNECNEPISCLVQPISTHVGEVMYFSSVMSASTLSNHVLLGRPTGLLPSTRYSIHFFTHSSSLFLITCPYHLSLPLLMTVVIGSTSTKCLNSSLVLLSFIETPHSHLIICISALSNVNPTSASKGLVSLS